ncbi:MAG: hypothetical protein H8E62_03940 [Planctomycetes bacterium]|nr:hypothetical protein [Planctomycetota bacterium]
MSGKTGLSLKYVRLFVILLFTAMVVPALGYEERARPGRDNDRPGRAEDPRREKMRQEARKSAPEIAQLLTQILEQVNQNQKPEAELIEQAVAKLEESKRSLLAYDDDQKAQYMLLQAWTDFYQGNLDDAMNWSLRACKMDASSRDAWNSQAVFCLLSGKRPQEPRIEKSKSRTQRDSDAPRSPRARPNGPADIGDRAVKAEPYSQQGTLDFELTTLRKDMLKERFERVECQDADGKKIEYVPGKNTLCIFFWQVKPAVSDANDVAGGETDDYAVTADPFGLRSSSGLGFIDQRRYVGNLTKGIEGHPEITCFALNTNSTADVERAVTEADEDFALEMGAPLVFAAADLSGAEAYVGLEAQKPFMLVADKEGVVRYAGPAADFMPAFILTHLSGVAIALDSPVQSHAVGRPGYIPGVQPVNGPGDDIPSYFRPVPRAPEEPKKAPKAPVAEPNAPVSEPKAPEPSDDKPAAEPEPAAAPKPADEPKPVPEETVQYRQLPLEEDVQAQKELVGADTFIKLASKRGLTYKRGVEMCRAIIKKYPGTQYEHDARELLKQVPEHKRGTYHITDEELGL